MASHSNGINKDDSMFLQGMDGVDSLFNEPDLRDILMQFNNAGELKEMQMDLFGVNMNIDDPQMQLPELVETTVRQQQSILDKVQVGQKRPEACSSDMLHPHPRFSMAQSSLPIQITEPPKMKRKNKHNLTEKKRRMNINEKIDELKELIPPPRKAMLFNKLSILHESVEHMRQLQALVGVLNERYSQLEEKWKESQMENKALKEELMKCKGGVPVIYAGSAHNGTRQNSNSTVDIADGMENSLLYLRRGLLEPPTPRSNGKTPNKTTPNTATEQDELQDIDRTSATAKALESLQYSIPDNSISSSLTERGRRRDL